MISNFLKKFKERQKEIERQKGREEKRRRKGLQISEREQAEGKGTRQRNKTNNIK